MKPKQSILDDIEAELRRHVWFVREEEYVATALWLCGSYCLGHNDIKTFSAFPMLAFMSPEPDSGKSRALKVAELVAYNAMPAGKYTPAMLLAKIDKNKGKISTICLDEIDTVFAHGRDNAELILLFNLGYERGAVIGRLRRFSDGEIETPAYCPKVFAGLKIARIPGPTKTRTIIINMQPKPNNGIVEEYIDAKSLEELKGRIAEWAADPAAIEKLKTVDLGGPETTFLNNRDRQIWKPLLAIAKVTNDEWYQRALKTAKFCTAGQQSEKNLSHRILNRTYRVFRSGDHAERLHSADLEQLLHELGIPKWVDTSYLADCYAGYDPTIKPRQMKIDGINRNGYDWHTFFRTWNTYLSQNEVIEIERELGIRKEVEPVDLVASRTDTQMPSVTSPRDTLLPSTHSTPIF